MFDDDPAPPPARPIADCPRPRRWWRPRSGRTPPPVRERLLVGAVVWGLFLAACCRPAVALDEFGGVAEPSRRQPTTGWVALAFGWFPHWTAVPWSANVWLALGWLRYRQGDFRPAEWYGVTAVAAGLTSWLVALDGEVLAGLLDGYYLWQASLLAFAVAVWVRPTGPGCTTGRGVR